MAKRLQEILEDAGLNRREARVYLAVLQRPEASLADIAQLTLIPRMSCYAILHNLLQKGFVDTLIRKRRRYFVAVTPQRIQQRLLRRASEFQENVARFERYQRSNTVAPRTRIYEGIEGIRTVFRDILETKKPLLAITSVEDMERASKTYFEEFIRRRKQQRLRVRLLTNRTPKGLRLKQQDGTELRETRFVPGNQEFHTAEYIFGDTVALISFRGHASTALLIEDPEITKTHTLYFNLLWQQAENR